MDNLKILSIVDALHTCIPDGLSSSERADVFVYFAVKMGMTHLLRPEAQPPDPSYVALPQDAPERYQQRKDRRERPANFIARVYAPWLGKGLARNHLMHLDRPLYDALYNWLKKNEFPDWLDLPKLKELNDRQLADLGLQEGEMLPHPSFDNGMRDKLRLYHAAKTRARMKNKQDTKGC
ncbi:hypothetical protein BWR17_09770 [Phaeobacter inhibens]|uniref:hypothetical protein n=1 Tax=Phaeobacter inhibens TaxID=221822 RepID=UPI0009719591|nr:hypothetical protein [Phaeobacter inhibens]APX16094.1 hypothetical protein BWR17_09770 [Phaeobacter inhibens]